MGCKGKRKKPTPDQRAERLEGVRANLGALHARLLGLHGKEAADNALLRHRLNQCSRASDCGRLCPNMVKGIGVALIHCAEAGVDKLLYERLADVDFECPRGLF